MKVPSDELQHLDSPDSNKPAGQKSETAVEATSHQNKSASSPFLRLSAELRNQIYEEAFSGTVIFDTATTTMTAPLDAGYSIILACKQTYIEALGLYYITHTFRFSNKSRDIAKSIKKRCDQWLSIIGPHNAQLVKRIELDLAPVLRTFPSRRKSIYAQWSDRKTLDLLAVVATGCINAQASAHKLLDGIVVASICSPLDGEYYTSTPRKMLEQHREILRLGRHDHPQYAKETRECANLEQKSSSKPV
jgi:hypothetical protein